MRSAVKRAFLKVRVDFSADRVIADPALNPAFIAACRDEGLGQSACDINRCLLNMRKASALPGLKSRRTTFPDQDGYIFASEIAIRFLERRDGVTLDQVICDPTLAKEFDQIAARVAPGYTPLQYRWAALGLRKTRGLQPEPLGHVVGAEMIETWLVAELRIDQVPAKQGLYLFFDSSTTLYVGETTNLAKRIAKHLDHSDNRGLAHWLWEHKSADLHVEYHVLPADTKSRVRKAMETELIRSRDPVFNIVNARKPRVP